MDSRISKTSEKYRDLRTKYEDLRRQGFDKNSIRTQLGLTPVQFHTLKNREDTSGAHFWKSEEEEELFGLCNVYGTNWELIRDALNEKFGCSLTKEQVKNKFYALCRKLKCRDCLRAEGMPETRRGRRPRKDPQHRQKRQPPVSETPAPQNPQVPKDPLGGIPEPPRPPQCEVASASLEPMGPESDTALSSCPEDLVEHSPIAPSLQTVELCLRPTGPMPWEGDSYQPSLNRNMDW